MILKKLSVVVIILLILPSVCLSQSNCPFLPPDHPCYNIFDPVECDQCLENVGAIPIDSHIIVLFFFGLLLGLYSINKYRCFVRAKS